MSESAAGISVSKPQNIWKRQVKVNLRSLFSTLGKAALNGAFSRLCVIIFAYEIVKCLLGKTFRNILLNKLSV